MTSRSTAIRRSAVIAGLCAAAAGCGGSGSVVRQSTSTTPTSVAATSTPSTSPTSVSTATQHVTITPPAGLSNNQSVLIKAQGFSPGEALVVTECAANGKATGSSDCDLTGMQSVSADAGGEVTTNFTVTKGPFGADNITCSATQGCLISVTQASPSPTQEADAPISFK